MTDAELAAGPHPPSAALPPPTVYKFGGTSLADASRLRGAARLVASAPGVPVVVVSAMGGVTSELERMARLGPGGEHGATLASLRARHLAAADELLAPGAGREELRARIEGILGRLDARLEGHSAEGEPPPGWRDAVSAAGEDLSAALMAAALRVEGLDAVEVNARDVVRTDARFGQAVPVDEATVRLAREHLTPHLARGSSPVLQGFIGADEQGRTTTLGRGGSDFTAAIVGAALGAPEVTIWTDVDGVFSADPRWVPGARVLAELGFEEAVELAYFGAKVIHPAAAKHAVARSVALRVRNTFRPDAPGTLVRADRRRSAGVAALAHKPGTTLIRVRSRPHFMAYGFLARVFEVLTRHRVPVDLVATSHTSTAFTVDGSEKLHAVRRALEEVAEVEVLGALATVSVVGRGLLEVPGISADIFAALGAARILLISQATDTSLSLLVPEEEGPALVRRLHEALLEGREHGPRAARGVDPEATGPGRRR